jgi:hypothetical protein
MGYKKSNMRIEYEWPTILENGSVENRANEMVFWIKSGVGIL